MRVTAEIDTKPVGTYYHQLAVALGQGLERTIRMEAAATVRRAMQLEPVKAKSADYLRGSSLRNKMGRFYDGGGIGGSINSSKRKGTLGRAWLIRRDLGGKVMPLYVTGWDGGSKAPTIQDNQGTGARVSDDNWAKWKATMKRAVDYAKVLAQQRIGARGLTQKSWFELILKIAADEPVNAPATVMRARPVKGGSRTIATAIPMQTKNSFTLTVGNDSGIAAATDGQRKLNTAISIRRAFFRRNLENGFLSDAKFIARNYPWAKVSG